MAECKCCKPDWLRGSDALELYCSSETANEYCPCEECEWFMPVADEEIREQLDR